MGATSVKINTKAVKKIIRKKLDPKIINSQSLYRVLSNNIRQMSLNMVAVGKSPVRKNGRFSPYAAQRFSAKPKKRSARKKRSAFAKLKARISKFFAKASKSRPSRGARGAGKSLSGRYPEIASLLKRYPSKKTRPVNLKLDPKGPYLKAITQTRKTTDGLRYGLLSSNAFMSILFDVHNEGAHPDVPQRKVIPTKGDDFTGLIRKKIKDIYLNRIKFILKK